MKKLKLLMIILIISLLILLVILLNITNVEKKSEENNTVQNTEVIEENNINEITNGDFKASEIYSEVTSPTTYYTVNGYIIQFFNDIRSLNNINNNINKLLNIIDNNYLEKNSITATNIKEKLSKFGNSSYTINNIYEYAGSDTLTTFLINGQFASAVDGNTNYNIFLLLDYSTGAYKIYLGGNETNFVNGQSIELNQYNSYKNTTIDDLTMCNNYLNLYIENVKNNTNNSYNLLNENYRNKRFKNIQNYIQYINENKDEILNSKVDKYKVNVNYDGSKQYIIIDNYSRYYIINAKSVMTYSIMLDSYTTPLSETTAKYNSSSEVEKAGMCLEMVKEMINNNDYQSMYNHLNETFKTNNFTSLEEFSNLIKNKYYESNNFSYESYSTSNNNYIINVKVSDNSDENKNFNISFIVKLGSSIDDFEMSFNI